MQCKSIKLYVGSHYDAPTSPCHKNSHAALRAVEMVADGVARSASCFLARCHLLIAISDRGSEEEEHITLDFQSS